MPFGVVGRTGPGMRQVVGFGERTTGKSKFGGKYLGANMGRPIITNEVFTIGNSHGVAARLLLGEFLELQARRAGEACRRVVWLAGVATRFFYHTTLGRLVVIGFRSCSRGASGLLLSGLGLVRWSSLHHCMRDSTRTTIVDRQRHETRKKLSSIEVGPTALA